MSLDSDFKELENFFNHTKDETNKYQTNLDNGKTALESVYKELSAKALKLHNRVNPVSDGLEAIVESKHNQRGSLQEFIDKKTVEKDKLTAESSANDAEINELQKLADNAYKEYEKEQKKLDDYNKMIRDCNKNPFNVIKYMFSKKELWEAVADSMGICKKKWSNYQEARTQLNNRKNKLDYAFTKKQLYQDLIDKSLLQLKEIDDDITTITFQISTFNEAVGIFMDITKNIEIAKKSADNGKYTIDSEKSLKLVTDGYNSTVNCHTLFLDTITKLKANKNISCYDKVIAETTHFLSQLSSSEESLDYELKNVRVGGNDDGVAHRLTGSIKNTTMKTIMSTNLSRPAYNIIKDTGNIIKNFNMGVN